MMAACTTMVDAMRLAVCAYEAKEAGRSLSTVATSVLKRLSTRPSGIVSKKATGQRSTRSNMRRCATSAAEIPPSAKAAVFSSVMNAVAHVTAA